MYNYLIVLLKNKKVITHVYDDINEAFHQLMGKMPTLMLCVENKDKAKTKMGQFCFYRRK